MSDEEQIDQQAIDDLLATAKKELSEDVPSELPTDNSESSIMNEGEQAPVVNKTDSLSEPRKEQRPKFRFDNYSTRKKIGAIILLFIFVTTFSAFLGFKLSKKAIESKPPLEKIIDSGITFEEKSMVTFAGRGDQEIVTAFIEAGMPVNSIRSTDGWTPLISACFFKKTSIVQLLLEQQANINIQDKYGKTPLMYAAAMGAEDIVELLLTSGASPNIQDKNGRTALIEAYTKQQAKIAEILKAAGADPNLQPITKTEEQTPLSTIKNETTAPVSSKIAEENRLEVGKVGLIKIGMSIEDLQKKYTNIIVKDQFIDGNKKSIATIYLTNKNSPSLKVELTSGKIRIVSLINTYDDRFKTDKNISIKSTVGEICEQYPVSDIKVANGSLFLVVKSMKMLFEIDTKSDSFSTDWFETNHPQSIPSNTKIIRIINY